MADKRTGLVMKHTAILKIQLPISSNEPEPMALVYNKDRSFETFLRVTPALETLMDGQLKAYFRCEYDDTDITVLREVGPRDW